MRVWRCFGIFLAVAVMECYFGVSEAKEIPNAQDYLSQEIPTLKSYYKQVKKQSIAQNYPIFRSRYIIEHSVYSGLSDTQKQKLRGQLVLTDFIFKDFIKYSNLGGIGVGGVLAAYQDDKKAKMFYLSFDGRYLSDLEFLGFGSELFAYCVLPNFNHCILLGIGEDWK